MGERIQLLRFTYDIVLPGGSRKFMKVIRERILAEVLKHTHTHTHTHKMCIRDSSTTQAYMQKII